ncbi:MAG: leucine-rich repeat domain-containing protein [Bacteroides sp.]|nr:leucine-rich repeat domain-containing protein [Bacteroides sp.]
MKNKAIFSFAAAAIFALAAPFSASAVRYLNDYPIESAGDYTYIETEDGVSLISYDGAAEHVTVPAEINGKAVKELISTDFERNDELFYYSGSSCFFYNVGIGSVELPDSVETVGEYTFGKCEALSEVKLPVGLKDLPKGMFYCCSALSSVDLPESIRHIGASAFEGCTALGSVTVPEGAERIDNNAFAGCESLSEAFLPSTLKVISNRAFYLCGALERIKLPDNVSYLGAEIFSGSGLISLRVPDGVCVIAEGAFKNCAALREIRLSDNLVAVDDEAFSGCASLESVVFPEGVFSLGKGLFTDCKSLKSVYIPKSVGTLGDLDLSGTGPVNISFGGTWEEWQNLISEIPSEEADIWKINIGVNIPYPLEKTEDEEAEAEEGGLNPSVLLPIAAAALVIVLFTVDLALFKRVRRRPKTEAEKTGADAGESGVFRFEPLGEWECDKCGTVNGSIGRYCYNCGRRKRM